MGELLLNFFQRLLGQCEHDGNGLQLCEHNDAVGVSGANDIAFVNHPNSGAPLYGGCDGGVIELHPGAINSRLVRFDRSLKLVGLGRLRVIGLLGEYLAGQQGRVPLDLDFGKFELRFILRFFCLCLGDLGLEGGRIDLRQDISRPHILSFAEA